MHNARNVGADPGGRVEPAAQAMRTQGAPQNYHHHQAQNPPWQSQYQHQHQSAPTGYHPHFGAANSYPARTAGLPAHPNYTNNYAHHEQPPPHGFNQYVLLHVRAGPSGADLHNRSARCCLLFLNDAGVRYGWYSLILFYDIYIINQ